MPGKVNPEGRLSRVETLLEGHAERIDDLEKGKVSNEAFWPVQKIAYGVVAATMLAAATIVWEHSTGGPLPLSVPSVGVLGK